MMMLDDSGFDPGIPPRPNEVTRENWDELSAGGFRPVTNLGWPFRSYPSLDLETPSPSDWVDGLRAELGEDNVKLGDPTNHQNRPDPTFERDSNMIGVYIKDPNF